MTGEQNPTATGSRVLRNSLVAASTGSIILSLYRTQDLRWAKVRPETRSCSQSLSWGHRIMHNRYPKTPGAKGQDDPRQAAAAAIMFNAPRLGHTAMMTFLRLGKATVLEAVAATGLTRESFQPRFSELHAPGLVEPIGARRRKPSAKAAAVMRLTEARKVAVYDGN